MHTIAAVLVTALFIGVSAVGFLELQRYDDTRNAAAAARAARRSHAERKRAAFRAFYAGGEIPEDEGPRTGRFVVHHPPLRQTKRGH
jgi:hypothetical protein